MVSRRAVQPISGGIAVGSMQDLFALAGRRVCVTGASSGIGRALADGLARAGASVVGIARRQTVLDEWRDEQRAAGLSVEALSADLGDPINTDEVAQEVSRRFGAPDILVNAAGVNPRRSADDVTPEEWQATLDLNLSTPFFLARAFVPAMRSKGWGRVLNIASLQSARAFPNGIAYGASKGGIAQVTRAMAEAWSADGIMCNAIAPGFFPTALTGPVFQDAEATAKLARQTCIGRNGILDDLIGPALFFASRASDYITGQILYVDGGFTAK